VSSGQAPGYKGFTNQLRVRLAREGDLTTLFLGFLSLGINNEFADRRDISPEYRTLGECQHSGLGIGVGR